MFFYKSGTYLLVVYIIYPKVYNSWICISRNVNYEVMLMTISKLDMKQK